MKTPCAVLFDLDGTLLDTAPDLLFALNKLRATYQLPPLSMLEMRRLVSLGSKAMVEYAFNIKEDHPEFSGLREAFLALYENHLADSTRFFPDVEKVLHYLETNQIPWGIVTNKLTLHTLSLLKALKLIERPGCIICGDSLSKNKPHPEPLLYACQLLKQTPENCLYIGDAISDIQASKAAGMPSLVALYGYIHENEDPFTWSADGYIKQPLEIIDWLTRYP